MSTFRIGSLPLGPGLRPWVLLLALHSWLPLPQARAQYRETPQDTTPPQPISAPVPASGIPQAADAMRSTLRQVRERLGRRDAVSTILEALPPFLDTLDLALQDPAYQPREGASLQTLDRIRRRWSPFQARLTTWRATLDRRSRTLAAEADSLFQSRRVWQRTQAVAEAEPAPSAVLDRITLVLTDLDATDVLVRAHLEGVLTGLDQIGWAERLMGDVLAQIGSGELAARQRLLSRDGPTLWQAIRSPTDTLTLWGQVRASGREVSLDWGRYVRGSREEISQSLLAFLLLLLLLQALSRQGRSWERRGRQPSTSPELAGTQRVLSRPISAALLVSALWWRLTYPDPSASVGVVVVLALLVPVWRLLPSRLTRDLRRPMLAVAGVWVLGEGALLVLDGSLLQRLTLLLTAILAGIGLHWALRPDGPLQDFATRRWWRGARLAARAAIIVLGASVLANVMGFTSLAELLTRATVHSAVVALVLSTVVTVLEGLIWIFLHADWAHRLRVIRKHSGKLTARLIRLAQLGVLLLWIGIVLTQFGIRRHVLSALANTLGAELAIGTFALSLGDLLAFAVVLWVALFLSRGIRGLLEEDVLQALTLPRGVPAAISTLVYYAAVFIGFLMAAAAAGFDMSRFTLLAGAFGVGLGFGLQNVVNNFVSGLILIFERPVQVGDVLDVGGLQGKVQRIGIRASTVRTWGGAEVIVPNGDLISQQVTNWTLSDRLRRLEIPVGLRYGTDPERVIDLLTQLASRHPGVLPDPPATTLFLGFGESSLDFLVRAWTSSDDWRIVQSDLTVAINKALKQDGIEIPFPQRDLHVRSMNPEIRLKG